MERIVPWVRRSSGGRGYLEPDPPTGVVGGRIKAVGAAENCQKYLNGRQNCARIYLLDNRLAGGLCERQREEMVGGKTEQKGGDHQQPEPDATTFETLANGDEE